MTGQDQHSLEADKKKSHALDRDRVKRAYQEAQAEAHARSQVSEDAARYSADSERYHHRAGRHTSRGGAAVISRKPLLIALIVLIVVVAAAVGIVFANSNGAALKEGGLLGTGASTSKSKLAASAADDKLPTPIMAESEGVELHSAIAMDDLTEILIHNASYSYAEPITTKLKEANNDEVIKEHGTHRDASKQPTGDKWMTGEFIRCYRAGNGGPRMSAIDCGAKPGTQVYSPVSGKVLLVKKYKLYDLYTDYQVHIQPTGHENLDVVLIHLTDVICKAGDTVTAGVTPLARVRNVYKLIGNSMQLKEYTAKGDNGNHTHIQVNNVNAKNYHGLDDLKKKKS